MISFSGRSEYRGGILPKCDAMKGRAVEIIVKSNEANMNGKSRPGIIFHLYILVSCFSFAQVAHLGFTRRRSGV